MKVNVKKWLAMDATDKRILILENALTNARKINSSSNL